MSKNIFITGTGTDVGKTYITGLILKKLRQFGKNAAYFKAAMSGNERSNDGSLIPGDAVSVQKMSGIDQPLDSMCPFVYETAVSPHLAAKQEGRPVNFDSVLRYFDFLCGQYDYVIAEGSGGIFCPLRFDEQKIFLEDFIRSRGLSCVIVADAGLGTINAVVLTAEYMKSHGITAKGIILNHYDPDNLLHRDNEMMCSALTGLKILARIKEGETDIETDGGALKQLYD